MRECVVIKGSRQGLQLVIDSSVDFEVVLTHLRGKLESAIDFFAEGSKIKLPAAMLTQGQIEDLGGLLENFGLEYDAEISTQVKEPEQLEQWDSADNGRELIVTRTIRGGQEIIYSGSVIVNGDLNPGGEVVAGGNVVINGACRGIVHAGAYGDRTATITAKRLLAAQVRIAGVIARAPDNQESPQQAEIAYIEDGKVIIAPAESE